MQMVFVKDLDSVVEWVLGKFMGNTKLGGVVDMLKGRGAILGDLNEWEGDRQEPHEVQWKQMPHPARRMENLPAAVWTGDRPVGKQLSGKGHGGPCGQQIEHEWTMCPCRKKVQVPPAHH